MKVAGSTYITTVKDDNEISGFAKLLRDKLLLEKTSWDITLEAVEHLDTITDSSIGLTFGVLCLVDPEPDSIVAFEHVEHLSKESIIRDNNVNSLFDLYNRFNKNGLVEKLFSK